MATLSRQQIVLTGLNVTMSNCDVAGDKFTPGDTTFIIVQNDNASPRTVTVNSVRPSDQGTDEDIVVAVASGDVVHIGPFPANRFAGTSDGLVSVTYSAVTDLDIAAIFI